MPVSCSHLDGIQPVADPATVCEDCVVEGGRWVNLRQCLTCGGTRCCDSSPNTHATRHHDATGHPVIRSAMPGQDWLWCYGCRETFRASRLGFVSLGGR